MQWNSEYSLPFGGSLSETVTIDQLQIFISLLIFTAILSEQRAVCQPDCDFVFLSILSYLSTHFHPFLLGKYKLFSTVILAAELTPLSLRTVPLDLVILFYLKS